jgi:hypothetical protein
VPVVPRDHGRPGPRICCRLAASRRVIRFDSAGIGESDGVTPNPVRGMAEIVLTLVSVEAAIVRAPAANRRCPTRAAAVLISFTLSNPLLPFLVVSFEKPRRPWRGHSWHQPDACGYKLANAGRDTRSLQAYLGIGIFSTRYSIRNSPWIDSRGAGGIARPCGRLEPAKAAARLMANVVLPTPSLLVQDADDHGEPP